MRLPIPRPLLPALLGLFLAGCATGGSGADRPEPLIEAGIGGFVGPSTVEQAAADADVVYVGESHDQRAHHEFQLRLLEAMQESLDDGERLYLGMEMFQRAYQAPLDRYVAGEIDEKTMLRETEYFTRWRFDYTLYAPLWRFCREHGGRVIALNADRDVVRKIGRQGLDALTPEERGQVAEEIDLTVGSHRDRIMSVFTGGAHTMPEERLRTLYEAQTTWDETMAESAARALGESREPARMLLVAGAYHIQERDGIPDRLGRRLTGLDHLVVVARQDGLPMPEGKTAGDLGDFVVSLPASPPAPKLGVTFDTEPVPGGLRIMEVAPGGSAANAGVHAGDVLVALNGSLVRDMVDLRYAFDGARVGEVAEVHVFRDGIALDYALNLVPTPRQPRP